MKTKKLLLVIAVFSLGFLVSGFKSNNISSVRVNQTFYTVPDACSVDFTFNDGMPGNISIAAGYYSQPVVTVNGTVLTPTVPVGSADGSRGGSYYIQVYESGTEGDTYFVQFSIAYTSSNGWTANVIKAEAPWP